MPRRDPGGQAHSGRHPLREGTLLTGKTYKPFGDVETLWYEHPAECCLVGPAGTGKSRGIGEFLLWALLEFPGSRVLAMRKTRVSMSQSWLVTWEDKVLSSGVDSTYLDMPLMESRQRDNRPSYKFKNGSELVLGGMDQPTRLFSTEYDIAYCFVGDTMVASPSAIQRAYRRLYSGQLITIETAAGNKLTGTPNHPILTDQGWVALGRLHHGHHVLARPAVQGVPLGDPHVQHNPAAIAEVFGAVSLAHPRGSKRVVGVPMDFHGDGRDGDVDVVSSDGHLHHRGRAGGQQHLVHGHRVRRDLQTEAFVRDGALGDVLVTVGGPTVLGVRHGRVRLESLPPFGGLDPGHGGVLGRLGEPSLPRGVHVPDVPVLGGRSLGADGHAARTEVVLERGATETYPPAQHGYPSLAFGVVPDRIVKISRFDTGSRPRHVYNLQTKDHYYLAGNIVASNCNECNELTEGEWESLHRALRNNKMPFQRLIGDMNPDAPTHWMRRRMNEGRTKEYIVLHKDNPSLTPEYLKRLSRLTGTRRARLYEGRWVAAEGQIWENFDQGTHLLDKVPTLPGGRSVIMWKIASVDWGFRNPGCIQVWGVDNDNRIYLVEEVYFVEKTIDWWLAKAKEIYRRHQVRVFVCDPAEPGFIYQFRQAGLPSREANNDVLPGLDTVRNRLDLQPDGRPSLHILRGCTRPVDDRLRELQRPIGLLEEIPGYVWKKVEADKYGKEEPEPHVAAHACDACRYSAMYLDKYGYADEDDKAEYKKGTMGDIMDHEGVWEWSRTHEETYGRDWIKGLN